MFLRILILSTLTYNAVQAAVKKDDISYQLYTRNNPNNYISCDPENLNSCNINISVTCKFIIHGYFGNAGVDWIINMKDVFLNKAEYNIIAVDWSNPANKSYKTSAKDTRDVGKYVGEFIIALQIQKNNPIENIHCLGHSLGAHVCAFAGQYIKTLNMTIARITGLDPALPEFFENPPNETLSIGDATFIDIIHTDSGVLGLVAPIGNIDFNPNGGIRKQPGCLSRRKRAIIKPGDISCSHTISTKFYIESINSYKFVSKQCPTYKAFQNGECDNNPTAIMGENVNTNVNGTYYLNTNPVSPYAQG